jgi:hypothetical protein
VQAIVPVLVGAAFIAVLFGVLWIAATVLSRNADDVGLRVGDRYFQDLPRVDDLADSIAEDGPLLLPGLTGPAGQRPIGIDHTPGNDFEGWRVFELQAPGKPDGCLVRNVQGTAELEDCDGEAVDVADLATAADVVLTVDPDGEITIDLQPAATTASPSG